MARTNWDAEPEAVKKALDIHYKAQFEGLQYYEETWLSEHKKHIAAFVAAVSLAGIVLIPNGDSKSKNNPNVVDYPAHINSGWTPPGAQGPVGNIKP